MHAQRRCEAPEASPSDHDQKQAAVLSLLLAHHPSQLTESELMLELCGEDPEFGEADAVEVAIRELIGAGLLHRHRAFLVPSRAARRSAELEL